MPRVAAARRAGEALRRGSLGGLRPFSSIQTSLPAVAASSDEVPVEGKSMFASASLAALHLSLLAAPRAASLGAGFRRATEETYPRRLLHGQLLPRLISSDAFGSNKHPRPSGLAIEFKRCFLTKAFDAREPAYKDPAIGKLKEAQQDRQEYRANTQVNIHNTYNGATMSNTAGGERSFNFGGPLSFAGSRAFNENRQFSQKKKKDFIHVLLKGNKTFVTVTDSKGNKKTGASAGCLEDRKGRSRLSRYAAEATAEHVGRSARKMGLKSVIMKVKGTTFFRKKKKVILGWREGFRGERVRDPSPIMFIHDVTQLPHNGCRLPKQRRI